MTRREVFDQGYAAGLAWREDESWTTEDKAAQFAAREAGVGDFEFIFRCAFQWAVRDGIEERQTNDHNYAMELADQADAAKRQGDIDIAQRLLSCAFHAERAAALTLRDQKDAEPSRSVLFRSAASLAIEAGQLFQARCMIQLGLAGNPPIEIAKELRELEETILHISAARRMHTRPEAKTVTG